MDLKLLYKIKKKKNYVWYYYVLNFMVGWGIGYGGNLILLFC